MTSFFERRLERKIQKGYEREQEELRKKQEREEHEKMLDYFSKVTLYFQDKEEYEQMVGHTVTTLDLPTQCKWVHFERWNRSLWCCAEPTELQQFLMENGLEALVACRVDGNYARGVPVVPLPDKQET
ncbi:MAG: hypothetical protein V1725_00585 [archaeon]